MVFSYHSGENAEYHYRVNVRFYRPVTDRLTSQGP